MYFILLENEIEEYIKYYNDNKWLTYHSVKKIAVMNSRIPDVHAVGAFFLPRMFQWI